MLRIGFTLLVALAIAACGSRQDNNTTDGDNHNRAQPDQVEAVDWVLDVTPESENGTPPQTRVSLSLTDETGATRVEPMGTFQGTCTEVKQGPGAQAMEGAILGLTCSWAGAGTELRLRRHNVHLILLRAATGEGLEISYEEAGRVAIRQGAEVRARE